MIASIPLFPYQDIGAEWVARRIRCGLLDTPGLGKTAQIIRAIDLRRLTRGVVVCPAHLRSNWLAEFQKFSSFERRIVTGKTVHDFTACPGMPLTSCSFLMSWRQSGRNGFTIWRIPLSSWRSTKPIILPTSEQIEQGLYSDLTEAEREEYFSGPSKLGGLQEPS